MKHVRRKPVPIWDVVLNILKVLVTCNSATKNHNKEYRSIKLSTYGIMFFGTPHAGADGAEFQVVLTNIGRLFVPGSSSVVKHLIQNSEYLRDLNRSYLPISQDFRTFFFWEEYCTPVIGGLSVMVKFICMMIVK